ncbi:hypothetical protein CIB95_00090 [Lottiidibacillus patelloidae]|uniref:GGDEF domain-containing protein n=1 Tax=Lottiidibacillus patelloidae TaxID=2670334 RepID=A0A263BWI3_9BACI|nr:EAL domain-containing protein [Lottiidibacillus patelloidae]OZM58020.1 hypothetical protein CIB95_00090 [Lottiidibacillus patelloidae]
MVLEKLKLKAIAYPLSALFILASIIIDGFIFENRVEAIWMANILSILVVAYIRGFKSGIIISGMVTGSHVLFSILIFSDTSLINTVFFAVFFFTISVLFCYLVDIVQRRVNILEAFRKSPNAMFWVRLFNPERVFVAEGIARLYGADQKDFEENPDFWFENVVKEDKDRVKAHETKYLNGENSKIEFRIRLNNGETRWIESYAIPIINKSGKPFMVCGSVIDITSKKEAEVKLEYMAYHDSISGLKNRFKLEEDLHETCLNAKEGNEGFSLLFLDVGRLKEINDTLGHNSGDQLLKEVGKRLIDLLGIQSYLYRYISQEFIILLRNTNREKTESIVNDIITCLSNPVTLLNGREVYLTPKIGIVCSNEVEELKPEYLITAASLACVSSKKTNAGAYVYYNFTLRNASNRTLLLEDRLQKVLANNELEMYYQAKVNLMKQNIVGVEALLRWNDKSEGFISPMEFIPIAENNGTIIQIGKWVLEEACQQAKKWFDEGHPITVSVNVSVIQFKHINFVQTVKDALLKTKLPPQYLILEITESLLISPDETIEVFHELKELGVKISLDDFGTGYSSLSVLVNLPIDELKIDRSFVIDMMRSEKKRSIIKNIIKLGNDLNISTVAEGIETEDDLSFLKGELCELGQGYLFLKPVPANELIFDGNGVLVKK